MTTEERFDQLEGVMVESLRKQDQLTEDVAHLREEVSDLNGKVVRIENRLGRLEGKVEDYGRNLLELRRDTERFQQETSTGITQIINLIQGLGK